MKILIFLSLAVVAVTAKQIEKTCEGEPETGLCEAYMPSWYYDVETETCQRFVYGGCGGNGNRYRSKEECLENCKGTELEQSVSGSERCYLTAEAGLCDAYIIRYYFDKDASECRRFVYGGCGGNENNFETLQDCKMACK